MGLTIVSLDGIVRLNRMCREWIEVLSFKGLMNVRNTYSIDMVLQSPMTIWVSLERE